MTTGKLGGASGAELQTSNFEPRNPEPQNPVRSSQFEVNSRFSKLSVAAEHTPAGTLRARRVMTRAKPANCRDLECRLTTTPEVMNTLQTVVIPTTRTQRSCDGPPSRLMEPEAVSLG